MSELELEEGDMVQLKSGGPIMTVTQCRGDKEHVTCQWFTKDEVHHLGPFMVSSLKIVKATE